MLARLVLLFLLTPAVELALLIQVDALVGFWATVGLIVATGIVGSFLARREGVSTWRRLNVRLQSGELPGKELVDGVIILVAGALLVTPGVLTDAIGFLGLLPPSRALVRRYLVRRFRRKMSDGSMEVQFGVFGGAGMRGGNAGAEHWSIRRDAPADGSSHEGWKGRREQVPGHSNDTGASAEDDTAKSS